MRLAPAAATVAAVFALAAPARAEPPPPRPRAATLGVIGGVALVDLGETDPYQGGEPRADGLLGATLAWDTPPPAYPATPGYAVRGDIVPEVQLLRLGAGGLVLGGLRLELDIAQKEQGLLQLSARSAIWVAAHAGAGDLADGLIGSAEVGSTIYVGEAWRFGYGVGALMWQAPVDGSATGGAMQLDAAMLISVFVGSTI